MLARTGKYDNCLFHRLVPGFMVGGGTCSLPMPSNLLDRYKPVTRREQALVDNLTGALHSETNTI